MTSGRPLVVLHAISKRFPGVRALEDVTVEIRAGEVHCLTGENGSGKSTLSRVLAGVLRPDGGEIRIDGRPVRFANPAEAIAAGIVMISQELTLAPTLSVAENIFLGRLPRRGGLVDWPRLERDAAGILRRLDVHVSPRARVSTLSVELRQEIEIARALSSRARVLILDEATSSLSEAATRRLMTLIARERDAGMAVIMITHRMPEIYAVGDTATVLRDGRKMGTVPLPRTTETELVRMMVGREIGDFYGKRAIGKGEAVLEVRGLRTDDGALKPADLTLRRGEILGIAGLVGSGKSELGLALGGAIPARGDVTVAGRRMALGSPRRAIAAGIGFVPDDRKSAALLLVRSVQENFALAWNRLLLRFGLLDRGRERREVAEAMRRYGVAAASPSVLISTLSGGNQQKVILGRTFRRKPDVLVLSEPTRGVDVGAKSEIYRLIQDAAENRAGIVMISSELPELLGIADRIAVFFEGRLQAVFDRGAADEETIAHVAVAGNPAPRAVGTPEESVA